jgi:hypothetical protein
MKFILEFNLPDDELVCLRAIHADEAWNTIASIQYLLRQHYKHDVPADVILRDINNELSDMTCINLCNP